MLNSRPVRRGVAEIIHGVGRPRLNLREIKAIQLPVPPRDEQQRIVEVIEEQFSRLDASVASLYRAKRNLARLRASILQAAVEGRLARRNTSDRHARDLLADIANTKGSAPKARVRQTTDRSNRWRLALPINWAVAFPDEVTAADPYALSIGPFGSNLKVSDYRSNGVPLVFVRNIRSRSFGGPDTKFVSKDKAAELAAHRVDPGDVLITKMGDPPGDAAIYEGDGPGIITADCIKLRPHALIEPRYLELALNSPPIRTQILQITKGVAQLKVSLSRFRSEIGIPIPPAEEQRRIVAEVERQFSIIDSMYSTVDAGLHRSNRLRQSILEQAFNGRLVGAN